MGLDEMTKNDMDLIAGTFEARDKFCSECGIRLGNKHISRTCTAWDKAFTCYSCYYKGKDSDINSCWCGNSVVVGNKRCATCLKKDQPSIMEHPDLDYHGSIMKNIETRERLKQYRNRYLYMDFVRDKPGVTTRYRGPIVDRDVCHYCGWKDTGAHSPVDLLFYQGTRYNFCNPYRKDYKKCYEKWREENNMRCEVEYDGLRCVLLKDSPEGYKHGHEFVIWEDKKRVKWIHTTLDMEVTYHYEKELGMIVGGEDEI